MTPDNTPIEPVQSIEPVPSDPAEAYVAEELRAARSSLTRTRIGSSVAVALLGAYLVYVTLHFKENLQPKAAAEAANTILVQRMEEGAPQFAAYLKEKVPEYISEVPDYAIRQLPIARERLEDRLEEELQTYARQSSDQLTKDLDAFLLASKDDINTLLKDGDNPAVAEELGKELEKQFLAYLQGTSIGGESIKQKIDHSLEALMHVRNKTAKLAANKGLNPTEKKARRAIAIMLTTIDRASAGNDPHIKLPKVSVDKAGLKVQQ